VICLRPPSSVALFFVYEFLSFFSALVLGVFISLGLWSSWLIFLQELGCPSAVLFSFYCRIRVCVGSILFCHSLVNFNMCRSECEPHLLNSVVDPKIFG
jgi:hypothetical protein